MSNGSRCCRPVRVTTAPPLSSPSETTEPPVRRWPHPVECSAASRPSDATTHYLRCALAYQNELLAEIKTLLEILIEQGSHSDSGPSA